MELQLSKNEVMRFFQEHTLRHTWTKLFNRTSVIHDRIYELLNDSILKDCEGVDDYLYNYIYFKFKYYFFTLILNEAVRTSITEEGKYDVMSNVLELITEERLRSAVYGEIMIDALADTIREIKTSNPMSAIVNEGAIQLLRKKYLRDNR